MATPITLLHVEDNSADAELVLHELKKSGYDPAVTRVQTKEEFLEHLLPTVDIILADYALPEFTGLDALILAKERYPEIPLIIVTGVLTDERTAEATRLGAADYLLKDRLARLGDAVKQAIEKRKLKQRDLEQAAELLESEERFRLLYENSMDAILLTVPDGTILAANPAACKMFGRTEEEITRGGRNSIVDITDQRLVPALVERMRTGKFAGELTFVRKDGTKFPGEISSSLFTDRHGQTRTSMLIRDISERKRAEEKISLANHKLALMNEVAYQDIQNKVTALRGYVELSKGATEEKERTSFLETEMNTLESIHDLIRKTKDYQQMGMDKSRWISVEETVRMQFSHTGGTANITLVTDVKNLEVFVDPLIDRVFFNLIDNSLRHGRKISRICLRHQGVSDGMRLIYEDDGIGIPDDKKPEIFERIVGGSGKFGLFFVREFLTLSGMSIEETGYSGKCARFEITIPRGMYRFSGKK